MTTWWPPPSLDRLLPHRHIVNIRGNSYRMRDRGDLDQVLPAGPREEELRTRAGHPGGGAPVTRSASRARIPGRSLRGNRARPSRQNLSEKPASNPKSVKSSNPSSVHFSNPIDARGARHAGRCPPLATTGRERRRFHRCWFCVDHWRLPTNAHELNGERIWGWV